MLSGLALLLKKGIYIATPDGEIVGAGPATTAEEASPRLLSHR